ncbi:hypothetical protein ACO0RG_000816 [Hanseniaspora osmophila]|uniref:V-type proton ATPase subunit G n=1 Tax=Hanseniaspora osmophila TaxID=56408 RepID=A0A1E5R184_9ASCO|nr:V-type proton ATPase subunit G [Hanseniaspora osmophila]
MAQTSGIATLLKAEKEAQTIVAQARQYRQEKLKQAKKDAQAEIQKYKAQKETELTEYEKKTSGSAGDLEKSAENDIQGELKEIEKLGNAKKSSVIDLLVKSVTTPTAEIHVNAK